MERDAEQGQLGIRRKRCRRRHKLLAIALLEDFAKNTTLHGLRYITERRLSLIEKIFWIITFLISLSLCLFLIRNVWVKWQTSPVIVALSEHLVSVGEVPFPSVTICPQIKAKRTVYNFTEVTVKMRSQLKNDSWTINYFDESRDPSINKFEDIGLICWKDALFDYGIRNYSDAKVIENIIEVSPTVEDIFYDCIRRQTYVSCKELFKPVLTMEGVCFTMNSLAAHEIFRVDNIQKNYSYLNTSIPSKGWSYIDGYTTTDSDVYPFRGQGNGGTPDFSVVLQEKLADRDGLCNGVNNRGYKVYLQHPADMPQSSLYYYAALPQQTSSFALKFSVLNTSSSLSNYSPETRQCYFPEERWLKYFLTYTPNNCRLECLSNYTFEKCDCVWFHMPHDDSLTICRQAKKECVLSALDKYAAEEGLTDTKVEKCSCLPSCVGIQYDAEILKTNFDTNSYYRAVQHAFPDWLLSFDLREIDETIFQQTKIDLYYKEPGSKRFVSMRRSELFGLTDFLANCGGLLGLFLGFSFLSIVEIIYFCTLRLGFTIRRDEENERDEKRN